MSEFLHKDFRAFGKAGINYNAREWLATYELECWKHEIRDPIAPVKYQPAERKVQIELTSTASITLPGWLSGLTNAIKASKSILEIGDSWDEYGSPAYDEETLVRAINLLVFYAIKIWEEDEIIIDVPRICPSQDGSIDLFWETDRYKLLLNIPRDETALATYYGRHTSGEFIDGGIFPNSFETGISQFLLEGKKRSVLSF